MFRVKVREESGNWSFRIATEDADEALYLYNNSPVPRILIGPKGIMHKQYTDNGFVYTGKR